MKILLDDKKILDYLIKNNLSPKKFCKKAGIHPDTFEKVMNKKSIFLTSAAKILAATGLSREEIFAKVLNLELTENAT